MSCRDDLPEKSTSKRCLTRHKCAVKTSDDPLAELIGFIALTVGATAALHLSIRLLGLPFSLDPASPALYLYLAGLAVPSAVALLMRPKGTRGAFCRSVLALRGSPATYAVAIFAQVGIVLLAWVMLIASGEQAAPGLSPDPLFFLLVAGQIWVVLGEEPGWRGFALPRLESLLSPRLATLTLGLIWGAWHTPMFFVANSLQGGASPWLFASSIFAWSAVHTALYHRAGPSVVPNMLFHACANVTLNTSLVPVNLESYLLASNLVVGLGVLVSLSTTRDRP